MNIWLLFYIFIVVPVLGKARQDRRVGAPATTSSSSASRSSAPSVSKTTYTPTATKTTTTTTTTRTYSRSSSRNYNSYFDSATMRTYAPLYVYYHPPGVYFSVGFYSPVYHITYYDGYGFNFYYNQWGYYETSPHPKPPSSGISIIWIVIFVVLLTLCYIWLACRCLNSRVEEEEVGRASSHDEEFVQETVTVETKTVVEMQPHTTYQLNDPHAHASVAYPVDHGYHPPVVHEQVSLHP